MDQPGLERCLRAHLLAFGQVRQRLFQAEDAHHAHHAATTGQQPQGDLRQAELHMGLVQGDAPVAGQGDLPATTQRGTVDGRDHRFAEGLETAQLALDLEDHLVETLGIGRGDLDQFVEVAAGEEGLLRRGDDDPGDGVLFRLQAVDDLGHGLAVHRVHGVGTLAGHIHGQDDDSVLAFFVADGVSHFFTSQIFGECFRGVTRAAQARRKSLDFQRRAAERSRP